MFAYTREILDAAERYRLDGESEGRAGRGPQSARVFQNSFLELMSKSHPITPGLWFGPFILWAWVKSPGVIGLGRTAGLFALGVLVFSLFEYGLHRAVFHGVIRAAHDQKSRFRAFMLHGYHHAFPNDRWRLVMPPMISWPIAVAFAAAYYFAVGPDRFFPLLTGTFAGYVAYDWIHYYTHHFTPRRGIGKWLRTYHMKHHYQDLNAHFGISSPLWDLVFATFRSAPPKRSPQSGQEVSTAG